MPHPLPPHAALRRAVPLLAAAALLAAGCSSSSGGTGAGTTTTGATATSAAGSSAASPGTQATPAIVDATTKFLATLTDDERNTVRFAANDTTQKQKWSNLPTGLYERAGLAIGAMTEAQVTAFLAVMQATLSTEGYNRVMAEWAADDALAATSSGGGGVPGGGAPGGGGGPGGALNYGKQYYYVAIIGDPSTTDGWQWQFGGHHVTVNATIKGDSLSLTPSFIGAQPASYAADGSTISPLGDINDTAFSLVQSLDDTQRSAAVLGATSIDLVLGPGQDCRTIAGEGVKGSDLTTEQQATLVRLMGFYGGLANAEDAAAREAQLTADLADTYFAWYGPTTSGSASYFRVSGPHVDIEFSPQSMGGDATNHIHGIYRDPTNDYGGTVCS